MNFDVAAQFSWFWRCAIGEISAQRQQTPSGIAHMLIRYFELAITHVKVTRRPIAYADRATNRRKSSSDSEGLRLAYWQRVDSHSPAISVPDTSVTATRDPPSAGLEEWSLFSEVELYSIDNADMATSANATPPRSSGRVIEILATDTTSSVTPAESRPRIDSPLKFGCTRIEIRRSR